jgi:tetratricopeptide (TPR) repeat protein
MIEARAVNDNNSAVEAGEKAISLFYNLDPSSTPVLWYVGNSRIVLKQYERALKDFEVAGKHHPYNHYLMNDHGSLLYLKGDIEGAKRMYEKAISISPHYSDALINLSIISINNKDTVNALRYLNDAPESAKKSKLLQIIHK